METTDDDFISISDEEKRFDDMHLRALPYGLSATMLILAGEGRKAKADLARLIHVRWQTASEIVDRLRKMGFVTPCGGRKGPKGRPMTQYGLTCEGLLSFLTRVPTKIDVRYLCGIPPPSDVKELKRKLESQKMTMETIHLMMAKVSWDTTRLTKHHHHLFPLVFRKQEKQRIDIDYNLPEIAFQSLQDYYFPERLDKNQNRDLREIFTRRFYQCALEMLSRQKEYAGFQKEYEEEDLAYYLELYKDPELTELVREISANMTEAALKQTSFLCKVEQRMKNLDNGAKACAGSEA